MPLDDGPAVGMAPVWGVAAVARVVDAAGRVADVVVRAAVALAASRRGLELAEAARIDSPAPLA